MPGARWCAAPHSRQSATDRTALPHAKAMRILVGDLRGIEAALNPGQPVPACITDIRSTIEAAIARYGSLAKFPYQEIVKQIAAYQGRQRTRKKR